VLGLLVPCVESEVVDDAEPQHSLFRVHDQ
jgi:hypothetical protein